MLCTSAVSSVSDALKLFFGAAGPRKCPRSQPPRCFNFSYISNRIRTVFFDNNRSGRQVTSSITIAFVMGANIGASIGQICNNDDFRRIFSAAIVHACFKLIAVTIFLPLELMLSLLEKLSAPAVGAKNKLFPLLLYWFLSFFTRFYFNHCALINHNYITFHINKMK